MFRFKNTDFGAVLQFPYFMWKYGKNAVPALEKHCVDFLKRNLGADNAFMLLTQVSGFGIKGGRTGGRGTPLKTLGACLGSPDALEGPPFFRAHGKAVARVRAWVHQAASFKRLAPTNIEVAGNVLGDALQHFEQQGMFRSAHDETVANLGPLQSSARIQQALVPIGLAAPRCEDQALAAKRWWGHHQQNCGDTTSRNTLNVKWQAGTRRW